MKSETEGGFTLLETLVAFSLIALVLGAGYGAMSGGVRAAGTAGDKLTVLSAAESVLAQVGAVYPLAPGSNEVTHEDVRVSIEIRLARPDQADAWRQLGTAPFRIVVSAASDGGAPVRLETLRLGVLE